jgi:hypothetical protein
MSRDVPTFNIAVFFWLRVTAIYSGEKVKDFIQGDSGGKVSILGGGIIGNCGKETSR